MRKRIRLVAGTLTLCLLVSGTTANAGGTELTTIRVASGLTRPLFVTHSPGDADRIYIVEKPGTIKVMDLGTGVVSVFLDITARVGGSGSLNGEQGLFALAFHPDFANNSFFYVDYTNNSGDTRVSRFTANDADNADSGSEFVIGLERSAWIAAVDQRCRIAHRCIAFARRVVRVEVEDERAAAENQRCTSDEDERAHASTLPHAVLCGSPVQHVGDVI